jgi:hypothetical protein
MTERDLTLATSADIKPDFKKSINSNEKKALVELMNNEFEAQRVVFDQQVKEKQDELLEKRKKRIGFDTLKKTYEELNEAVHELKERKRVELEAFKEKQSAEIEIADNKVKRASEAVWKHGFDVDGDLLHNRYYGNEMKREYSKKAQVLKEELDSIRAEIYPAENQRNKYTALLWSCSTYGEAMVIMREVLGNGIIPSIKKTDLPYNDRQITQQ